MKAPNPYMNNPRESHPNTNEDGPFFPFTPVHVNGNQSSVSEVEEMNNDFVKQAGLPATTSDQAKTE